MIGCFCTAFEILSWSPIVLGIVIIIIIIVLNVSILLKPIIQTAPTFLHSSHLQGTLRPPSNRSAAGRTNVPAAGKTAAAAEEAIGSRSFSPLSKGWKFVFYIFNFCWTKNFSRKN